MTLRQYRPPQFKVHPFRIAVATLFGLAPCVPGFAQEAVPAGTVVEATDPAATGDGIEEITVTATRRDEGVQDVPLNITAVTGDAIAEQKLENLADLVRVVPGLFLVDQGGRDANLLTVRGLNVDALGASEGVGSDGGGVVAQYIGDVPLFIDLRLKDLERVEALLGPQGTLYGAGTLGGAIRYLPKRPQFNEKTLEFETGTFALAHSQDFGYEGQVVGNLPLGERLAVRALFGVNDEPGFIDQDFLLRNPGVSDPEPDFTDPAAVAANLRSENDTNDLRTTFGRLALRYGFTENIEATLSYHFQKQQSGGRNVNHVDALDTGPYESAERYLEPNERKFNLGSLELQADLGFATLTSATGYSQFDEDGQRDQTDLLLRLSDGGGYGYEDFPAFSAFTHDVSKEKRLSQELRLVSNDEGRFNWIAGVFYNDLEVDAVSEEFVPGLPEFFEVSRPDNLEYLQLTTQDFKEKAVFGELGFDVTDKFTATVGARWFEFEDDTTIGLDFPLADTTYGGEPENSFSPTFVPVSVSDDDVIFKGNLSYDVTDDVLVYLTVSEGYRSGGSNAVPLCSSIDPGQQTGCTAPNEQIILPDKTLNHELGARTTWLGGRLIVNSAAYFIRWDDIQVDGTTDIGAIPITVNAAEAESWGVELAAQALLGERWTLSANYAYNKAELSEDSPGVVGDDTGDTDDNSTCGDSSDDDDACDGDRLPGSPRQQAHATLAYEQPLPNGMRLIADYGVAAQSDIYTRVGLRNNGEVLSGYAIHDAAVGLRTDRWTVRLYAKNLFDKYAVTGVRASADPLNVRDVFADSGDSFRLRGRYNSVLDPMRVGVTFTYRFDG